MKLLFSLLLFLTSVATCSAQALTFKYFNRAEGLSDRSVISVDEDSLGFLWVGTRHGLNRLEGQRFHAFYAATSGLNSDIINALCRGWDARLWIGTSKGLCVYDPRTDLITPFQCVEFDITDDIYSLCRDSLGDVWVLGSTSFYRISRDSTRNRCYPREEYFSPTCVCVTRSGDLWMAAWGGGLHRYDAVRDTFESYQILTPDEQQELNYITTLVETPSGQLFIGTRTQGARLFSPLTAKVQRLFTTDAEGQTMYIHCASNDSHGNVWIGTEAGIYEWNGQQGLFAHERKDLVRPNALIDNAVHVLYQDHSGGIWVGTYFGGICYKSGDEAPFSERLVTDDHGMPVGNVVREIAADDHGRLWVTTEDCGLCMMEQPDAPLRQLLLTWKGRHISNNVQTVAIVGQTAWIGTFDEGIYLIDVNTRNITDHFTTDDGSELPDIAVVHIMQTRKGQVLVGTMSGLSCYDGHGHFRPVEALNGAFVHDIMEAQDGSLWVASLNQGLFRISGEGTRLIAQSEPIPLKDLATVAEDAAHRIVIGTHSDGFHFYDPLSHELSEALLPDCGISRILRDALGNMWLTTTKGLFCYASADSSITAYGISEGLTLDHFSRNSGYQDNQGIIYAGTMAGLVSFNPRNLRTSTPTPSVFFVRQLPDGRPLLFTDHITLPHDATFTIEYATNATTAARTLWYRYRLEGTKARWTVTQGTQPISFYNLPPGDYALHIQATAQNGHWPDEESVLHIRVRQPWWWTWQARLAYLLLLALAAIIFYQTYIRRLRERRRIAAEQADASRYREVLQSKINFFTAITHEIRTPLTLITGSLERLKRRGITEDVDVMQRNTGRLLGLVNQLLDFRKIESSAFLMNFEEMDLATLAEEQFENFRPLARQRGVDYSMYLDHQPSSINHQPSSMPSCLVLADREALTKIISNLLSNALKFCEHSVSMSLSSRGDNVALVVSNDGPLIPADQQQEIFKPFHQYYGTSARATINGSGLGLSLARSLAEMHNGSLTYDTQDKTQNTFVLTLKRKEEPTAADAPAPDTLSTGEATVTGDGSHLTSAQNHSDSSQPEKGGSQPSLLLVDDERDLRQFVAEELAATYTIFEADNGEEALRILHEKDVALVITDLMMPIMDGTALCQAIRRDVGLCHLPIIVLTAKVSLQDHIDVLNCGADAYIEKPFATAQLQAQIANLLHSRELLRQTFVRSPYAQPATVTANPLDEAFLTRLNDYLNDHLADHSLSVEQLAGEMNMSVSTFYRKVKAVTSLSPVDYIRLCRLRQGAKLLAEGRYRVKEVADQLGFTSTAYFTTLFMRQFGMTPTDFMRSQNKDRQP